MGMNLSTGEPFGADLLGDVCLCTPAIWDSPLNIPAPLKIRTPHQGPSWVTSSFLPQVLVWVS